MLSEDGGHAAAVDDGTEALADKAAGPVANYSEPDDPKIWLSSHVDSMASLSTFSGAMALIDLDGRSGVVQFLAADMGTVSEAGKRKVALKVWRSNRMISSTEIPGICCGLVAFNMSAADGAMPAAAVAVDNNVLIFKNMKPYYKFTLPNLPVADAETAIWAQACSDPDISFEAMCDSIVEIRDNYGYLSGRSHKFLATAPEERATFIQKHKDGPLTRTTVIVAIATLFENTSDALSPQCIVIATEIGEVMILSPKNFAVIAKVTLPATPVFMSIQGSFEVDYRIVLACRDGCAYTIKKGVLSSVVVELSSHAVGLERLNKVIYIGCMDDTLSCYSTKGKRLWTLPLPASITTMSLLHYRPRNLKAVVVALSNGEVRLYNDRSVVNVIKVGEPVNGLVFGQYSRDDGVLILATQSGRLHFKILRRSADFSLSEKTAGPPIEQSKRIPVPAKTQLYLDQTQRERRNAKEMHRSFQRDMFRVRLMTARHYVKTLETSLAPMIASLNLSLRASAAVQGIGPTFKLNVILENTSPGLLHSTKIIFSASTALYDISQPVISTGLLVPGVQYTYTTLIKCIVDEPISGPVLVYITKPPNPAPLMTVNVDMPVAEGMETVR